MTRPPLFRLVVVLASLASAGSVVADPVMWSGNGHSYDLVGIPAGISWNAARSGASARTYKGAAGYLVTATSASENAFLVSTFGTGVIQKWMGGFQEAGPQSPSLGWRWITGEAWSYTNWAPNEPNGDGGAAECALHFKWTDTGAALGQWNDLPPDTTSYGGRVMNGYLVEFNPVPEPASLVALGLGALALLRRRRSA